MSIKFQNDLGIIISTEEFINDVYEDCPDSPKINPKLFNIFSPFCTIKAARKDSKRNKLAIEEKDIFTELCRDVEHVQNVYSEFRKCLLQHKLLLLAEEAVKNTEALETADYVYAESGKFPIKNSWGSNIGPPVLRNINNTKFIFPENATFYSKDVKDIGNQLDGKKFDLIVLDPPWYNKYIKRKRKKSSAAYSMMSNTDLQQIPIENFLNDDGIVVVWCTNCQNHLDELKTNIFKKWKVEFVAKWYWLKITTTGAPVCNYSTPPGKQPFEQIIIATKNASNSKIPKSKLVVSIPSAIHSHKPPLLEIFKPFLPENYHCLEIFARYLLPNCTSYGNEVLRFQHESLFIF